MGKNAGTRLWSLQEHREGEEKMPPFLSSYQGWRQSPGSPVPVVPP